MVHRRLLDHTGHRRCRSETLDVHLDQYDYLKKLIGVDHMGLGPDFVWGWGETFNMQAESSVTFPPEALSNGPAVTVKDYENISKLPNLIAVDFYKTGDLMRVVDAMNGVEQPLTAEAGAK